jgi:hypothetical protein
MKRKTANLSNTTPPYSSFASNIHHKNITSLLTPFSLIFGSKHTNIPIVTGFVLANCGSSPPKKTKKENKKRNHPSLTVISSNSPVSQTRSTSYAYWNIAPARGAALAQPRFRPALSLPSHKDPQPRGCVGSCLLQIPEEGGSTSTTSTNHQHGVLLHEHAPPLRNGSPKVRA